MPWPSAPERDRRLAGEHAGARAQIRRADSAPSAATAATRSSAGTHRPLGVVLLGDRRAPDRHHGVADELLDRAAVALDQRARRLEVAREQLPHLLGVAALRQRREADEVGEQDRDEPALGTGAACAQRGDAGVADA